MAERQSAERRPAARSAAGRPPSGRQATALQPRPPAPVPQRTARGFARRPVVPADPQPLRLRRLRLIEKFGGRRLHHHASAWRRFRSLVGIVLIGIVIAAIVASIIAIIIGSIALLVQHALGAH